MLKNMTEKEFAHKFTKAQLSHCLARQKFSLLISTPYIVQVKKKTIEKR